MLPRRFPSSVAGEREMAMYAAQLRCGTVLEYEAPSFVPNDGELVPCRHHGYCAIEVVGRTRGRSIERTL